MKFITTTILEKKNWENPFVGEKKEDMTSLFCSDFLVDMFFFQIIQNHFILLDYSHPHTMAFIFLLMNI